MTIKKQSHQAYILIATNIFMLNTSAYCQLVPVTVGLSSFSHGQAKYLMSVCFSFTESKTFLAVIRSSQTCNFAFRLIAFPCLTPKNVLEFKTRGTPLFIAYLHSQIFSHLKYLDGPVIFLS